MGATRDCKHGQLARSCEICGLEADLESQAEYIKELQARLAWLQKTLTGRQRRHYASALRQLRNFRDGLREARALYAEKSGKPDRFDDPSAWWQNPRDKCVVLWLLEWAEDVQADLIEQLGKERDALAAEVERLRRVEKAAKGLTTQLHAVHRDHRYYAVWQLAQQHMGQYQGPQYGREQDALDAALAAREALLTGEGE